MKIDRIDLEILDALQKDATLSTTDLAAQVGRIDLDALG